MNAYQILRVNTASKEHAWLNGAALVGQESIEVVGGSVGAIMLRILQVIVQAV